MAYIKEYWNNKEGRAKQAVSHTKEMEERFSKEIKNSVDNTILYDTDFICKKENECASCDVSLSDIDSTIAILCSKSKTAVLNFSSYKEAGGMFLKGSKAQEECLCHSSFLYNVLSKKQDFYDWNNLHKNKALYLNRALYTPNVWFTGGTKEVYCDVITCASPNKSSAQKYLHVSDEENTKALDSRIKFVLDIAKEHEVKTLILGAYGCGVFGQDPHEVASIFKKYLDTTHLCFDNVVFAIPDKDSENYKQFRDVVIPKNNFTLGEL